MGARPLTEEDILVLAGAQSFERGPDDYKSGALFDARRVGNDLHVRCEESGYAPDWKSFTPHRIAAS